MLAAIFAFQARAADPVFGTWQLNPARSTFAGDTQPKILTVRIEPHAKGEVFTLDRTETNGRSTSASVLLYFDGRARGLPRANRAPQDEESAIGRVSPILSPEGCKPLRLSPYRRSWKNARSSSPASRSAMAP